MRRAAGNYDFARLAVAVAIAGIGATAPLGCNALADSGVVLRMDGRSVACGTGRVTGPKLDPSPVRAAAAPEARQVGALHPGDTVFVCASSGSWAGVIIPQQSRCLDQVTKSGVYEGPCKSGWVRRDRIIVEGD